MAKPSDDSDWFEPKVTSGSRVLFPAVWGTACLGFAVVGYANTVNVPVDDFTYSGHLVCIPAFFSLWMTYQSSKPEKFRSESARRQLRRMLMVLGRLFVVATVLWSGREALRATWPSGEGTVLRQLKGYRVTVVEVEFAKEGVRQVGQCGLVGPMRRYTVRSADFSSGSLISFRHDPANPARIDLNVALIDRLCLLVAIFVLPSVFLFVRARRITGSAEFS